VRGVSILNFAAPGWTCRPADLLLAAHRFLGADIDVAEVMHRDAVIVAPSARRRRKTRAATTAKGAK
jgi:hypothetical protein